MKYIEPKIKITGFHSESVLTAPASVASVDEYMANTDGNLTVKTDALKIVDFMF